MKVTAEGIEPQEQAEADLIQKYSCYYRQGYYL
jgi:EAL domain-containing protein (putative c-di-GMP-specific phosphodiesterase class I)